MLPAEPAERLGRIRSIFSALFEEGRPRTLRGHRETNSRPEADRVAPQGPAQLPVHVGDRVPATRLLRVMLHSLWHKVSHRLS